jgi:hypothetical protein
MFHDDTQVADEDSGVAFGDLILHLHRDDNQEGMHWKEQPYTTLLIQKQWSGLETLAWQTERLEDSPTMKGVYEGRRESKDNSIEERRDVKTLDESSELPTVLIRMPDPMPDPISGSQAEIAEKRFRRGLPTPYFLLVFLHELG